MNRALLGLAALPFVGALAQASGDRGARARFPAPGRLVEVDGLLLHVLVEGEGPTVVIESGLGGSSIEWAAVAEDLRRDHTVVRYDRPGMAWSPGADCDRSPRAVAERLHALVGALDVGVPCVLVGHSLGGLYVRVAASLHPDFVTGLVLVDPSHEDMLGDPAARRSAAVAARVAGALAATAPFGVARAVGPLYAKTVIGQVRRALGPKEHALLEVSSSLTASTVSGMRAVAAEMRSLVAGLQQVQDLMAAQGMPPVPLTLISAAAAGRTANERKGREVIDRLHAEQVEASPNGRRVLAERSGHLVQIDEPELIARCVRETVAAVRS